MPQSSGFEIKLRFVPFGTSFSSASGYRSGSGPSDPGPGLLMENEIACDVGGECPPTAGGGFVKMVFDHHLSAEGRSPSAAAAVFAHAGEIVAWRKGLGTGGPVWIATHAAPDFDALCSAYLVRSIIEEDWPEAASYAELRAALGGPGRARGSEDEALRGYSPEAWFSLAVAPRRPEATRPEAREAGNGDGDCRWAFLLAQYASHVDACRRVPVRREAQLRSILYAALARGEDPRVDGLRRLFDAARHAISCEGLSPMTDGLFSLGGEFAPESALAEEAGRLYAGDFARARKAVLPIPAMRAAPSAPADPCESSASPLLGTALLEAGPDGSPRISAAYAALLDSEANRVSTDAIFLRDPRCLFFKDWAREDFEGSRLGKGFAFTAVAYSAAKEGSANRTRYVFSLDPERAAGRHLLHLWAGLQEKEARALWKAGALGSASQPGVQPIGRVGADGEIRPRTDMQGRAGLFPAMFSKELAWYDGSAYAFTIVETSARGTCLEAGIEDDLSDDEAARAAFETYAHGLFAEGGATEFEIVDYPISGGAALQSSSVRIGDVFPRPDPEHYRAVFAPLARRVDVSDPAQAELLGLPLWRAIAPGGSAGPPQDLPGSRLVAEGDRMFVWNRFGIACACASRASVAGVIDAMRDLAEIARGLPETRDLIEGISARRPSGRVAKGGAAEALEAVGNLMDKIADLQLKAARPDGTALGCFLEATGFEAVVASISEISERIYMRQESRRDTLLQRVLAIGTALGLALAFMQVAGDVARLSPPSLGLVEGDAPAPLLFWGVSLIMIMLFSGLYFLAERGTFSSAPSTRERKARRGAKPARPRPPNGAMSATGERDGAAQS